MSWRRFATLLRGLGPNSAAASRAWQRRYKDLKAGAGDPVQAVTGSKEQVSAVFSSLFGGRGKKAKSVGEPKPDQG